MEYWVVQTGPSSSDHLPFRPKTKQPQTLATSTGASPAAAYFVPFNKITRFEVNHMAKTLTLNDDELQLVVQLLERERGDLPAEIHHTDTSEYKEKLSKRLGTVNRLLNALKS